MKTKVTVQKKTESIEKMEMEIEFPCYRKGYAGFLYKFNSLEDCIWIMNSGSSSYFAINRTQYPDESHLFDEQIVTPHAGVWIEININ